MWPKQEKCVQNLKRCVQNLKKCVQNLKRCVQKFDFFLLRPDLQATKRHKIPTDIVTYTIRWLQIKMIIFL